MLILLSTVEGLSLKASTGSQHFRRARASSSSVETKILSPFPRFPPIELLDWVFDVEKSSLLFGIRGVDCARLKAS